MNIVYKIFDKRKFDLEIKVPSDIEIIVLKDKIRFKGTKESIASFAKLFIGLKSLKDGQLCKLDKFTLKVSDFITEDQKRLNWIELPNHA